MKTKLLLIIVIIASIFFPSSLAQFKDFEYDLITNDNNGLIQNDYIPVWFCYGRISNLHIYKTGYTERYAFRAENVICRLVTYCIFPFFLFFRHYTNGEKLVLAGPCYRGIIKDNFVCVIS